jgi:stress responsive alpha/beta barrel protein
MSTKARPCSPKIEALQPRIPGMLRVVSRRSLELENLEKGFRHGFIVEFDGPAALEVYQDNEDHRRTGARLVGAAEGGLRASLFSTSQPKKMPGGSRCSILINYFQSLKVCIGSI